MIRRLSRDFGLHPQRSFWLRCFLENGLRGWFVLAAVVLTPVAPASAQIAADPPFHLAHLKGIYTDSHGSPIADATVTLDQDDRVKYSTRTDRAGRFEIKHVVGRYWLHVHRDGFAPVGRQVIVGLEAATYLHGSTLYMIAGPGACTDDCSKVFTSKGRYEQAIRHD
jgi:hypothetical protein